MLPLHGIGSRKDLPLPFEYVVWGAALVVVITFVVALWAWPRARFPRSSGLALPALTRALDGRLLRTVVAVCSTLIAAWFAMALVAGEDLLTNPIFGWVYACWWVGLVPASLLAGAAWRCCHPLWALTVATRWQGLRRLPNVGVWPAAAGIVAFSWLELVQPGRATLAVLIWWVGLYWAAMTIGVIAFGCAWLRSADPFTAYADLLARLSPWQRIDGVLHLVNPLRHTATAPVPRGTCGLVVALLAGTAFDSLSGGMPWVSFAQQHKLPEVLTGSVGLAGMLLIVGGTLALAIWGLRGRLTSMADIVGSTMAPIVAGYALGHYASLLISEGQRTLIFASDPLGRGWNVFGTAERGVWSAWLDYPAAVALFQLACIVTGHAIGVLTAHEACLTRLRHPARLTSQLSLLAVMILYTCAGLGLLFAA